MTSSTLGGTFTFPGTSLTVDRLGYGAMQLAGPHVWGPPRDRPGALAVLREAVAKGVNHIDTSDFYGPHVTNQIIKEALHPYPAGLTLVTKVGFLRGEDQSWRPAASPAELRQAVQDNLKNLGLDAMDIVNLRVGGTDSPVEDSLGVLVDLQKEGLLRHIGLSNVGAAQVAAAEKIAKIVCVQNEYNLVKRGDDALVDDLGKKGIAYVPFFPLGGFSPLQSSELEEVARSLKATPMQVALAWLLQRAPHILVIPGTSSVGHLRENLAAAAVKLPAEALAKLGKLTDPKA